METSLEQAVALRPAWPTGWAELFKIRAITKGFFHPDTQEALDMALHYGFYFKSVVVRVLPLLMKNWQQLKPEHKGTYYTMLNSALANGNLRNFVMASAKATNTQKWPCLQIKLNKRHEKLKGSGWHKRHCKFAL